MNEDDLIVGYGFANQDNKQILRIVDRAYRFVKEFDYGKYNIGSILSPSFVMAKYKLDPSFV